ncbi:hypothetical protein AAUPMC_04956, partial [Pasteurella multocida subsp. multocida str. Anand1_cattle]
SSELPQLRNKVALATGVISCSLADGRTTHSQARGQKAEAFAVKT